MVAVNTGSILLSEDGRNITSTAVSTNIIIEVDGNPIGAIQSLSIDEVRSIAMIDEVGTDGHIDSVPQSSTNITGSCQRTRFNNQRALHAFSRGYIHIASQRIPFDIIIKDTFAGDDPGSTLVTTIKNVWFTRMSVNYQSSNFVIVEDINWEAETIFSTLGSGNAVPNATASGSRNVNIIDNDSVERETDIGGRRGSLNASGLLLAVDQIV